mgnify:CR=1 FL=1
MVANNSTKVNPFFIFHTTPTLSITIIQVYLHIRGMTRRNFKNKYYLHETR